MTDHSQNHIITDAQIQLIYEYLEDESDDKLRFSVFAMLKDVSTSSVGVKTPREPVDMVSIYKDGECTHRFPRGYR